MEKLTKKFIKKELQHMTFKSERIVDIVLTNNGKLAQIITISHEHTPHIYFMKLYGQRVLTYFSLLDYDTGEIFNTPISVTKV